jgi:hypothetical protein
VIFYYYSLLTVFAVVIAIMIVEPNVAAYIDLRLQMFMINVRRLWIMITMYPRLTYDKWKFKRLLKKYQSEKDGRGN